MQELIYPVEPAPLPGGCTYTRASEMLPVVDANFFVRYQAPRERCHQGTGLLHPVVHLHIINRMGELYLQQRSASKDFLPSFWDTAVGGHVTYGEGLREAMLREASEELGLREFNPTFLRSYVYETKRERELVNIFAAVGDFPLHPDGEEVACGRFWTFGEIEENMGEGVLTPNFEQEFVMIKDSLVALL